MEKLTGLRLTELAMCYDVIEHFAPTCTQLKVGKLELEFWIHELSFDYECKQHSDK